RRIDEGRDGPMLIQHGGERARELASVQDVGLYIAATRVLTSRAGKRCGDRRVIGRASADEDDRGARPCDLQRTFCGDPLTAADNEHNVLRRHGGETRRPWRRGYERGFLDFSIARKPDLVVAGHVGQKCLRECSAGLFGCRTVDYANGLEA